MSSWLPLLNYSTKYSISLSTLRRRIKAKTIEFRLDQGKYLILDEGAQIPLAPPLEPIATSADLNHSNFVEASVLTSANRLVEEIKAAYAKILQEKEEQISLLKEEIGDLRMLVRILEDSNQKTTAQAAKQVSQTEISTASENDPDFFFDDFQSRRL